MVPVWNDNDDDNERVNLLDQNRTKKLRTAKKEDVISGVEYEKRLRHQFETTSGVQEWAKINDSDTTNDLFATTGETDIEHS